LYTEKGALRQMEIGIFITTAKSMRHDPGIAIQLASEIENR
jgi:hypothetical protein